MPNSFHGNRIWRLHHNGFRLIDILSFILLIKFLAILDSFDGGHASNRQSNAIYIYVYVCIYLPVKVNEPMSLKSTLYDVEKAHTWWGLNPRSLDYIPSSINSRHVSDHQNNACIPNIFLYIRDPKPRNCKWKWQKYELQMNFTICGKRVPFTALHTTEMDSAQKKSYRNNKWSTFPQKCLQVFI